MPDSKATPAELAELVDALDSGSSAARLPGSSPGFRIFILLTGTNCAFETM